MNLYTNIQEMKVRIYFYIDIYVYNITGGVERNQLFEWCNMQLFYLISSLFFFPDMYILYLKSLYILMRYQSMVK